MEIRKAIIPAAGLGTRLLPSTKAMPKEMLPIIDKPTIQYIVEEAVAAGIEDIIIVTGKGKKAIEDHFDTSYLLEQTLKNKGKDNVLKDIQRISQMANIHYIRQGTPKGLGHAIWCARKFIGNEPFAVLLGDTLVKENKHFLKEMLSLYNKHQSSIIGVKQVPRTDVSRYGIVDITKGKGPLYKIKNMVEKPAQKNAPSDLAIFGRYVLNPLIFEILEKQEPGVGNEIQLTDALQTMLKEERIFAQVFEGESFDIGEKLGYVKTIVQFAIEREDLKDDILSFLKELLTD